MKRTIRVKKSRHAPKPTKRRYAVGEKLYLSGMDWEVVGHEGEFYIKLLRTDGEARTVSTMSILHGLEENWRNGK